MFEDENFTDPYFLYFHYPLTFDETIYVQGVYADDPNISDEEMIENAKKYVYRYIECDENIGRVFYSGFYGRYDDCIILCYYITHRDYLWPFGWSDDEGDAYTIVYKDKYLWVSYNGFHLGIISKDVYETYIYLNQTYGFPPHHKPI